MQNKSVGMIVNETCYRVTSPGHWELFVRVTGITEDGVRLDLEQPQGGNHATWKVDREYLPVGEGLDLTLDRLDGDTDSFRLFADDESAGMVTLRFELPEHLVMEMHREENERN
jgi:catechol 2,3-dioxygenase-like lactoylglutathione lyase family enzyme